MNETTPQPSRSGLPLGCIALAVLLTAAAGAFLWFMVTGNPARQRQRILELPFSNVEITEVRDLSETPQRRVECVDRIASYRVTTTATHVLAEIADVRLALESPASWSERLGSSMSSGSVVIDSNRPPELEGRGGGGSTGLGRRAFSAYRKQGVTTGIFSHVPFSIQAGELILSGVKVPIGKGRKVVFLRENGSVAEVVDLESRATR